MFSFIEERAHTLINNFIRLSLFVFGYSWRIRVISRETLISGKKVTPGYLNKFDFRSIGKMGMKCRGSL